MPPTRSFTCHTQNQVRDHIFRIYSGEGVLEVQKVHFELELILRIFRRRLRCIAFHWPRCPEWFGMIIGDFNICDPGEGKFSVRSQTLKESDAEKTALFRTFFHMLLKLRTQHCTRTDTAAEGAPTAPYSELTERSSMCPWRKHAIFIATPL